VQLADVHARGGVMARPAKEGITVGELVARVLAYRKKETSGPFPKIQGATYASDRTRANYFTEAWAATAVTAIGVPEARAFVRGLKERLAPLTLRGVVTFGKMAWDIGEAEGWIKAVSVFGNRLVRAEAPKGRTLAGKPVALSLEMADALVNGARIQPHRRARYLLAIGTGMSDGEIAGLRVADLELRAEVPRLRVARQLTPKSTAGYNGIGPTKTENRNRFVPLAPAVVTGLRWWLEEEWPLRVGRAPMAADPVFPRVDGKPYRPESPREIREDLNAMAQPFELPAKEEGVMVPVTFHATRRTFATLMCAAGASDEDTGAIMGHAGETVTAENYIDRDFRRLAGVVARHPLTFRGGAGVVRTADRPAQAIAVNARELIEFARSRGEARPWP
jgi:integrase